MPRFKKIHVVINPASGHDEPILNTLNDVFAPHDIEWEVTITHNAGDGAKLAQVACEGGAELVMAYGGDGTIVDVATTLVKLGIPLGVLPGGTANAFREDVGVPPTLREAAQLAVNDDVQIKSIDVGKVGDKLFLLRVGSGMVGTISDVPRELKNRFGLGAYIIKGIQALNQPQYVHYMLDIDGETIETDGAACMVSNGNSIGALNIKLSQQIKIDDGLLDVYVLNNDLPTMIAMAGSIANIDNLALSLQHWQGKRITISSEPQQGMYGDGEEIPFTQTPCTVEVLHNALQVLVPPIES